MEQRGPPPPQPPRAGAPHGVHLRGFGGLFPALLFVVFGVIGMTASTINGQVPGQLVSGLILVSALVAAIVSYAGRRADRRLWRDGELCEGVVVEAETSGLHSQRMHTVAYRYELPSGAYQNRRRTWSKWDDKLIWVIHDPKRPERSIPYPNR